MLIGFPKDVQILASLKKCLGLHSCIQHNLFTTNPLIEIMQPHDFKICIIANWGKR